MAETSDSDDEATDSGNNDNNFSNLAASSGHARTDKKAPKRSKHSARSSSSHSSKGSKTKENYDSIGVLPPPTGKPVKITVSKHGKGDYKTINEALNSIKPHAKHRTIIKIKAGVYKYVMTSSEQAQLARSALTLLLLAATSSWFVQFDMSVSST
jgi:pectin methylesterase-like acyl-CoA thioesterase